MAQKLNSDREVALHAIRNGCPTIVVLCFFCRYFFDSSHATLQTIHRELARGAFVSFIPYCRARYLCRNTGAVMQPCLGGRSCDCDTQAWLRSEFGRRQQLGGGRACRL